MRIHSVSSVVSRASNTPASLALVEINVQLVKSVIVSVHGLRKRKDTIVASGITTSDYQGTSAEEGDPSSSSSALEGVRVINGSLEADGRSGSELSWEFQDFIEVKVSWNKIYVILVNSDLRVVLPHGLGETTC